MAMDIQADTAKKREYRIMLSDLRRNGWRAEWHRETVVEPMMRFAPTGLFDRDGLLLREGNAILVDDSSMCWTVRYSLALGYVGYIKASGVEIKILLSAQPRKGIGRRRRWLSNVHKLW